VIEANMNRRQMGLVCSLAVAVICWLVAEPFVGSATKIRDDLHRESGPAELMQARIAADAAMRDEVCVPYQAKPGDRFGFRFRMRQSIAVAAPDGGSEPERVIEFVGRMVVTVLAPRNDNYRVRITGTVEGRETAAGIVMATQIGLLAELAREGRLVGLRAADDPATCRLLATVFTRSHQFVLSAAAGLHDLVDETGSNAHACTWDGEIASRRKQSLRLPDCEVPASGRVVSSCATASYRGGWLRSATDSESVQVDAGGINSTIGLDLEVECDDLSRVAIGEEGDAGIDSPASFFREQRPREAMRHIDAVLDDLLQLTKAAMESHVAEALHGELARLLRADAGSLAILLGHLRDGRLLPPRTSDQLVALLISAVGAAAQDGNGHCVQAMAELVRQPPLPGLRVNALVASHAIRLADPAGASQLIAAVHEIAGGASVPDEYNPAMLALASLCGNASDPVHRARLDEIAQLCRARDDVEVIADMAANARRFDLLADAEALSVHERDAVRVALGASLGVFPTEPRARSLLLSLATDESDAVRQSAAESMAPHTGADVVACLGRLATVDQEVPVRLAAVQALGYHLSRSPADVSVVNLLQGIAWNDRDQEVRATAGQLLVDKGPGHLRRP
jgi:hypothetical protein